MHYYEVLVADSRYRSEAPLTYSADAKLVPYTVVTIDLRQKTTTGFVLGEVTKPKFEVKPIKAVVGRKPMPDHCFALAKWLSEYYCCSLAEALRQFAPTRPVIARKEALLATAGFSQTEWKEPLTAAQTKALADINNHPGTTVLLHGDTGSGKTRVYLEIAKKTLAAGKSVILLTPEVSLTAQLASSAANFLNRPVYILHSQLPQAQRKKIWFEILESNEPVVIVGARSALFSPVNDLGLIVVDEAHEPAYKQDQAPRYQATRVASQLGRITGAKVVLGTATPLAADYYLAEQRQAVVRMSGLAKGGGIDAPVSIIDLKDRQNFAKSHHLSDQLIKAINTTLSAKKQILIYLNRRGSARLILCDSCGWQLLCPNCDLPLVYHSDEHLARCHTCGFNQAPPTACPSCANPDIIYRSIGTKALVAEVEKLFPGAKVMRFDSDNAVGSRLNEVYRQVLEGQVDILVGTQLLAKGLDLPKLGLVGVIAAETSLGLPDFTAEERTFQLLYQVIGRVGRGHGRGIVIVQSYEPASPVVQAAANKDWLSFYRYALAERQQFKFPPFSYLLQLTCGRNSEKGAKKAADELRSRLSSLKRPVQIVGPAPAFYARRGDKYYYQLVIKAKNRPELVDISALVPSGWQVNLDPSDLL